MSERTAYQHPILQPFSSGMWKEVALAWTAACAVLAVFALLA